MHPWLPAAGAAKVTRSARHGQRNRWPFSLRRSLTMPRERCRQPGTCEELDSSFPRFAGKTFRKSIISGRKQAYSPLHLPRR